MRECRIHLMNAESTDMVKFNIYYGGKQRMDVYIGSRLKMATNAEKNGESFKYSTYAEKIYLKSHTVNALTYNLLHNHNIYACA